MALGDSYATVAELKERLGATGTSSDTKLTEALSVSSRHIDIYCGRQFNKATAATARLFYPTARRRTEIDDFWTTSGLVIATDDNDDGTAETTWATTDYQLEPLNGIANGLTGWPYNTIRAAAPGTRCFPPINTRASVYVTAQWGWTAVPPGIKEACLMLAEETFKLKDAPWGIIGTDAYGLVRVRENARVCLLVNDYQTAASAVLIG